MKRTAPDDDLAAAVARARTDAAVLEQLRAIYRDVDTELIRVGQQCRGCGRCCDFDGYGHRLYVSTTELALLTLTEPTNPAAVDEGRCPYQAGAACSARAGRTLGCRIFSCQSDAQADHDRYDRYHRRIQALHQAHNILYLYMDLRAGLAELAG